VPLQTPCVRAYVAEVPVCGALRDAATPGCGGAEGRFDWLANDRLFARRAACRQGVGLDKIVVNPYADGKHPAAQ
jgi:hypothetical protein